MGSEQANHSQGAFAAVRAKDSSSSAPVCAVPECSALAATVLRQQVWCVDHFLAQSYQALEHLEQQRGTERGGRPLAVREQAGEEVRTFLNECSAQALNVSLGVEKLGNLERSRLLDILLWAGELSEALRRPAAQFGPGSGVRCPNNSATSPS